MLLGSRGQANEPATIVLMGDSPNHKEIDWETLEKDMTTYEYKHWRHPPHIFLVTIKVKSIRNHRELKTETPNFTCLELQNILKYTIYSKREKRDCLLSYYS